VAEETTQQSPQPCSITDLRPKMCLQGTVRQTQLYGALVDIGLEYDGMVHISQLAPEHTNRVTDVVQPGDNVTVWVTKVDSEKGRIGLTMVEPPRVDWHDLTEGQVHTGTVTRLEPYGAFVDIGAERAGLLHVREMSTGYVRHPSELMRIGEETEDEPEEEHTETAMEIALQHARTGPRQRKPERRHEKRPPADLSEREDILARTLKQHPRQATK